MAVLWKIEIMLRYIIKSAIYSNDLNISCYFNQNEDSETFVLYI